MTSPAGDSQPPDPNEDSARHSSSDPGTPSRPDSSAESSAAEAGETPTSGQLFSPAVLELAEQYQQLLNKGTAPSAEAFAARHPSMRDALLRAISLFSHLHTAGAQTQDEQEYRRIVSDATELASLQPDNELDHFIIDRVIGRGGMGIVYSASDDVLKRDVAIKVLNPELLVSSAAAREVLSQFEHEARATARLRHSGIMVVHGIRAWRSVYYIEMPFVDGRTWKQLAADWIDHTAGPTVSHESRPSADTTIQWQPSVSDSRSGSSAHGASIPAAELAAQSAQQTATSGSTTPASSTRSDNGDRPANRRRTGLEDWDSVANRCHLAEFWSAFAESAQQLARALEYAHHHEIMHRDVKPANVMMDARGNVQLMDFGLAWVRDRAVADAAIAGSRRYMSREQLEGRVSERSDVYGLGTTLLELAAAAQGCLTDSTLASVDAKGFHRRQEVEHVCSACPPDLRAIIGKSISNGTGGYETAAEFAAELQRFLDGAETSARSWSIGRKLWQFGRQHPLASLLTASLILGLMIVIPSYLMTASALQQLELANDDLKATTAQASLLAEERARATEEAQRSEFVMRGQRTSLAIRDGLRGDAANSLTLSHYGSWDNKWLEAAAEPVFRLNSRYSDGRWNVLATALSSDQRHLVAATADGLLTVWDCQTGMLEQRLREGRFETQSEAAPRFLHYFRSREAGTGPRDWSDDGCLSVNWQDPTTLLAVMIRGTVVKFQRTDDGRYTAQTVFDAGDALEFAEFADDRDACLMRTVGGKMLIWSGTSKVVDVELPELPGDARLTAGTFETRGDAWFAGFSDGTIVEIPAGQSGRLSCRVPGTVWSLHARSSVGNRRIAVGCQDAALLILEESPAGHMDRVTRVAVPQSESISVPLHMVRFAGESQDTVLAVDARSRFLRFDTSPRMAFESECGRFVPDQSIELLLKDQSLALASDQWPSCFLRQANTLLPLDHEPFRREPHETDPPAILIAGFNGLAGFFLDTSALQQRMLKHRLNVRTAPQPMLAADDADANRIWSGGDNGLIRLIDVWSDAVIAEWKLPADAAIAVCGAGDGATVVASPHHIHLLRLNADMQIEEVRRIATGLSSPLASLTFLEGSDDRPTRLAGVDRTGQLSVWTLSETELVLRQSFAPDSTLPFQSSGRAAFSPDGRWLIAGSSGQDVFVCEWNSEKQQFERRQNEFPVAGNGLEDVTFVVSAQSGVACLAIVDALNRLIAAERTDSNWVNWRPGDNNTLVDSPVVRLTHTPDGSRIIRLQRGGRLAFLLPPRPASVATIMSSITECCDVCCSTDGRTVLIAGADGSLERLSYRQSPELDPVMTGTAMELPARQLEGSLQLQKFRIADGFMNDGVRTALDDSGVCHAIVSEASRTAFERRLSRLWSGRSDQSEQSVVTIDGLSDNDRMISDSIDLEIGSRSGQPRMAFRCIPAEGMSGAYDGQVWFAERDHSGRWNGELIVENGNCGFHCNLQSQANGLPVLFHYSFHGYQTLVEQRQDDGAWHRSYLGPSGFGRQLTSTGIQPGTILVSGQSNRFNGDFATPRTYRWIDGTDAPLKWPVHSQIQALIDGPPGIAGALCREADSHANLRHVVWRILPAGPAERFVTLPPLQISDHAHRLTSTGLLVTTDIDQEGRPGLICSDATGSHLLLLPGSLRGELLSCRLREATGNLMFGFVLRESNTAPVEPGKAADRLVIGAFTVPIEQLHVHAE